MFKLAFTCAACVLAFSSAYADSTAEQNKKDATAMAILITLDNNEVNISRVVENKLTNDDAKDFAEMMIKDHSKNAEETIQLGEEINIKPNDSAPKVLLLKKEGEHEVKKFSSLTGATLEKDYVNAMVSGHRKALKEVQSLAKEVTNEKLKEHFTDTEKTIKHHLEEAEELQKEMK